MNVIHEPDQNRFVMHLPGGDAVLMYNNLEDNVFDFWETFVPPSERGKGISSQIIGAAMQIARDTGHRVRPSCPAVQSWLTHHHEADDLIAT